jgi:outer membrane scaffolding protein for murein synthesis (MipA/OmpV family)
VKSSGEHKASTDYHCKKTAIFSLLKSLIIINIALRRFPLKLSHTQLSDTHILGEHMSCFKKNLTRNYLIAASLALVYSGNALAIDNNQQDSLFALGVDYINKISIYLDGKNESTFYPSITIYWQQIYFKNYKVGAYLAGDSDWALSVSYGLDNREDIKRGGSDLVKETPDLNNVFVASIEGEFYNPLGEFNMIYSIDTSNEHKGKIFEIGYSYPWEFNQHSVSLDLKASWISKEVAKYYYSFEFNNKTENYSQYQPTDAINWLYGVSYSYAITPNKFISASISSRELSNKIKKSSLVDKTKSNSLSLGLIYLF